MNSPFSQSQFENLISRAGVRLAWAKSRNCPCSGQGLDGTGYGIDGSPREDCLTCHGYGVYWLPFTPPFTGLLTFSGFNPMPTEPGVRMDERWGQINGGRPLVTIPYTGNETIWMQAAAYDQIVLIDSPTRYSAILKVGVREALPYVNGLTVAPVGAVTVWSNKAAVAPSSYVVTGSTVQLNGYATGTPYTVEFYADQTFVLFQAAGGVPHVRAFGGGVAQYPRRFTADTFDIWLRQRTGNINPPSWVAPS